MRTPCFFAAARSGVSGLSYRGGLSVVIHAARSSPQNFRLLAVDPIFDGCLFGDHALLHVITIFLLVHSYVFFLESHFLVDKTRFLLVSSTNS